MALLALLALALLALALLALLALALLALALLALALLALALALGLALQLQAAARRPPGARRREALPAPVVALHVIRECSGGAGNALQPGAAGLGEALHVVVVADEHHRCPHGHGARARLDVLADHLRRRCTATRGGERSGSRAIAPKSWTLSQPGDVWWCL